MLLHHINSFANVCDGRDSRCMSKGPLLRPDSTQAQSTQQCAVMIVTSVTALALVCAQGCGIPSTLLASEVILLHCRGRWPDHD